MTIDELLLQFNESDIQEILNDVPGKTLVKFNGNYFYADCEDGIIQFLALYMKLTPKVCSSLGVPIGLS